MSYIKTNWQNNDIITTTYLNNIETIIENTINQPIINGLVVTDTYTDGHITLNKTYDEILAVVNKGGMIYWKCSEDYCSKYPEHQISLAINPIVSIEDSHICFFDNTIEAHLNFEKQDNGILINYPLT